MIFVTFTSLWSFTFFLTFSYVILVTSLILYVLPLVNKSIFFTNTKTKVYFRFINSFDFFWLTFTPLLMLYLITLIWSSPVLTAWFGHLLFGAFQLKITYFLLFNYLVYLLVFNSVHYFTSPEIFDYVIVLYHVFYWTYWLFSANSLFTVIFIIEVINVLIFFLTVSSTFSSNFFYKNLNFNYSHLLSLNSPYNYLQSLLYLFWISLLASLSLFLFLLLLYLSLHTFDWVLIEYVFSYVLLSSSYKDVVALGLVWFILMFSIFLKCGVAPVYFWKPTFFQGLPLNTLLFYVTFIYFNFLLFITHFTTLYLGELLYYYVSLLWLLILFCILVLIIIITEAYYLKVFLAISSILNSIFVFLLLTTNHTSSFILIL